MAKIDKKFDYLGLVDRAIYNHLDKKTNVRNNIIYMLNRSNIMFKYHNLPDTIPATELEKMLQLNGCVTIGMINGNLYALNGGLGGEPDVYGRPTESIVSVPYLDYNATWKIDKDCIVGFNDANGIGLLPMFAKYCSLMNETEVSMLLAVVNKRFQTLISATDDATINSARQFIQDIADGKIGVVADNKLFESLKAQPANNNVNLTDLIELEQYFRATLFNEIGLNANYNMKRERLTQAEAEMNDDNLYPLVDDMLNHRRDMVDQMNKMFSLDVTVEFNSSWDYRLYQGESIHNVEEEITNEQIIDNESNSSELEVIDDGSNSDTVEQLVEEPDNDGNDNQPDVQDGDDERTSDI